MAAAALRLHTHPEYYKDRGGLSRLIQKASSSVWQACDYITQTVVYNGLTPWPLICWGELLTQPSAQWFLIPASYFISALQCIRQARLWQIQIQKCTNRATMMHVPQSDFSGCSKLIEAIELLLGASVWVNGTFLFIDKRFPKCVLPSETAGPTHPHRHSGITSVRQELI